MAPRPAQTAAPRPRVAVLVAQVALMGLALGIVVRHERPVPRQPVGAALAIAGVSVFGLAAAP